MSCPHTPQQNGMAERKHRQLTEMGLTLMFQSMTPQKYWVEAFFTSNFLSNLLPTTALATKISPYEALFGKVPNYSALRTFGCACFPTLRDYARTKFDLRSLKCIFLGYTDKYKGYRCFYPPTGRVYLSRHVLFAEESFPFADTYINQQTASPTPLFAAWLQGFSTTSSSETNTQENGTTASTENHQQESMSENQPIFGNGLSEENSENMQLTIADPISGIPLQTVLQQDNETTPEQRSRSDGKRPECTTSLDLDPIGNNVSPLPSRLEQPASRTTTATESTHPMVTRSKAGISKPNKRYAMLAHKVSHPMPKTVTEALKDEKWTAAMVEEMGNCSETKTWSLVPFTLDMNVLGSKWVFRVKLLADGSLDKYKARLVAQGFNQEEGIDYLETYSLVVRSATVRAVLHLATIMNWELKQMDVKNAFLHGDLTETVYMKQPAGFVNKALPNHVCLLHKSLYGLKQSPRAWFDKFSNFLLSFGFVCSFSDPSLFVCVKNSDVIMLLLYVDDMVITGTAQSYCQISSTNSTNNSR